jgi:POT family proton-dependent oligopeptide transporter
MISGPGICLTEQVVNAALILLFIPLFEGCVYPLMGKCGVCTRAISRMGTGMVLCGAAFIMAALLEIWMSLAADKSVSVLWQLPQYVVLTSAEILFSIQGLAFSYAQAPASMKSVVTSAWLITVAVGNSVTIAVASVQFFEEQANEFFFFAALGKQAFYY